MKSRTLISIGLIFVGFLGLWYLFDNQGITMALFPIVIPAYLFWLFGGAAQLIAVPLFLYAMGLVILFTWLKNRSTKKGVFIITIGVLVIMHLICYQFTIKSFEQLGAGVGKQMLNK